MFVLETQPLPQGDSQWFPGHSPSGGARPRLASPDGLRQGLALGGLGSSQGGLSPGLRAEAMMRAKLKGTWRGPEVWGWAESVCRSLFYLSTMWVSGMGLRPSELVAGVFTH